MTGRLIAIVGPSGVGKDTVMEGLRKRHEGLSLVRRVITRPSEAGGEAFDGATEAEFDAMLAAGQFALHWTAHGLRYGIPATLSAELAGGADRLINLSRAVLTDAFTVFPSLRIVNLTAPIELLAARLAERGRENQDDIAKRLARQVQRFEPHLPVTHIRNDRPLNDTLDEISALLFQQKTAVGQG